MYVSLGLVFGHLGLILRKYRDARAQHNDLQDGCWQQSMGIGPSLNASFPVSRRTGGAGLWLFGGGEDELEP